MFQKSILIVDDEISVRTSLEKALSRAGYLTRTAASGNEAITKLESNSTDVVVSDLKMPDGDGLELLREIKSAYPYIEVVLLTGYGTIETAVAAMKNGAYDFITKPFRKAVLLRTLERALERQLLSTENDYLTAQLGTGKPYNTIIGKSQAMQDVLALVNRVAPLTSTVLITGGSGTGKELIARTLHRKSARADEAFVPVNCAAIPETLIESELFGHLKGAFTGAIRDKDGLFKVADRGTIFLDEVVSIPFNLQVKLLRAIEQKEIMPVGGTSPLTVDVRIIAATNKNLAREAEAGRFREDLYYRLNVVGINLPPLKKRLDDIPELVNHYIRIYNVQLNKRVRCVEDKTWEFLLNSEWKGNVRELENAVERAMIVCDGDRLKPSHFDPRAQSAPARPRDLKSAVKTFERESILRTLRICAEDKSETARLLGLSLSSLYRKMAELGIELAN